MNPFKTDTNQILDDIKELIRSDANKYNSLKLISDHFESNPNYLLVLVN